MEYLKKAAKTAQTAEDETRAIVQRMLSEIETGGEEVAQRYGRELDKFEGEVVVAEDAMKLLQARFRSSSNKTLPLPMSVFVTSHSVRRSQSMSLKQSCRRGFGLGRS